VKGHVVSFDDPRGVGEIESADGRRLFFHCTAIADGTRTIQPGAVVEFEVIAGEARGVVVATAPGLGQPRPRRRGEARGVLVYEAGERTIRVETFIWRAESWGLTAVRVFPRGLEPLAAAPHV